MPYLNVEEANSLMELLALQFPGLCELITLPNQTFEGRDSFALRIRKGQEDRRAAILLIGGQHAREWGSTDILLFLAQELLDAAVHGNALHFGNFTLQGTAVSQMLEKIELIVFPVVNPDGKHFSQAATANSSWRKNRGPTSSPNQVGTDLNRNYDWLWDSTRQFRDGESTFFVGSTDPASDLYRGTAPFSEPETRNVKHLLDTNPRIRFFVDVHSFSGFLMHPWADDDNQTTDPTMSFGVDRFDGQRGELGDTGYREYMSPGDLARHQDLVHRMNQALTQSRGNVYSEGPESTVMYRMSGSSADYAFSRHLTDHTLAKIDAFTIEWGLDPSFQFQPPFPEMDAIIREIAAALTALCIAAKDMPLVETSPDPVLFGNVAIGSGRAATVTIKNHSRGSVQLEQIRAEGPGYNVPPPHTLTLPENGTATVQVGFAPGQAGSAEGALRFDARFFRADFADNVEVRLEGGSCTEKPGDCFAPLIEPHGAAACAVIVLRCKFLLALLILFGGSECDKAKLRFRIAHCREGNGDPCLPLLPPHLPLIPPGRPPRRPRP